MGRIDCNWSVSGQLPASKSVTGWRAANLKVLFSRMRASGRRGSRLCLIGLLPGFSFAGATSRLDYRRQLIINEANAIGAAYLRLELLPAANQPQLRCLFRDYLDARLAVYRNLSDLKAVQGELTRVAKNQKTIWSSAVSASRSNPDQIAARLLLPAMNGMIDITTSRTVVLNTHVPSLIFALLIGVALLSGCWLAMPWKTSEPKLAPHVCLCSLVPS